MRRLNSGGGGELKPITGFAKIRSMQPGDSISGTYKGNLTTKGEYPKVNHLIELAVPFTFSNYNSQEKAEVEVNAQAGDIVALETTTVISQTLTPDLIGRTLTIVYEGKSKNKKPGQRPAYLVGVYEGLPEGVAAAMPKAAASGSKGFPFKKA